MKCICKKCQGTDIEVRLWYKPNVRQFVIKDLSTVDDDDVWCHSCDGGGFGVQVEEIDDSFDNSFYFKKLGDLTDDELFKLKQHVSMPEM